MHTQLVQDFMALREGERRSIQQALNITFERGSHESNKDFSVRVLTEVDNQGKIRTLEQLLNS